MIRDKVSECQVMLVVIGRNWVGHLPAQKKRRIDNPQDIVRLEVEVALGRGMPVIPLLVSRATMPASEELPPTLARLAVLNARQIRSRDFHHDMAALLAAIEMQRATWLALEAERAEQQRQRERNAASTRLEADASPARALFSGFGSLSENQLVTLAGAALRFFLTALRGAVGRALIAFVVFAAFAAGGAIGVGYAILHQSAFAFPTYLTAGWSALITGEFAGLFVIFSETIRAIELIIAEAERAQVEALREVESLRMDIVEDAQRLGRAITAPSDGGVIERVIVPTAEAGVIGRSLTDGGDVGAFTRVPGHHLLVAEQSGAETPSRPSDAPDAASAHETGALTREAPEISSVVEQLRRGPEER